MKTEDFHNLANQTRIKAESAYNLPLIQRPKKDLDKILDKNRLDRFVKPAQKFAKLKTKTNSKVCKLKTYN